MRTMFALFGETFGLALDILKFLRREVNSSLADLPPEEPKPTPKQQKPAQPSEAEAPKQE